MEMSLERESTLKRPWLAALRWYVSGILAPHSLWPYVARPNAVAGSGHPPSVFFEN